MNYEKAYKEVLERARKLWNEAKVNEYTSDIEDYETIFPELAESEEDERMLRLITEGFKNYQTDFSKWNGIPVEEIISWLEKQKELPKLIDINKITSFHWQSFRANAAKDILCALIARTSMFSGEKIQHGVNVALEYADTLIRQLREDEK